MVRIEREVSDVVMVNIDDLPESVRQLLMTGSAMEIPRGRKGTTGIR